MFLWVTLSLTLQMGREPSIPTAARVEAAVRAWHEAGRFHGAVLVADRGEVIWEGGFGPAVREWECPNGPTVRYPIASLTKQFTAVLTMQLVEQGRRRVAAARRDPRDRVVGRERA